MEGIESRHPAGDLTSIRCWSTLPAGHFGPFSGFVKVEGRGAEYNESKKQNNDRDKERKPMFIFKTTRSSKKVCLNLKENKMRKLQKHKRLQTNDFDPTKAEKPRKPCFLFCAYPRKIKSKHNKSITWFHNNIQTKLIISKFLFDLNWCQSQNQALGASI